MIACDRCKSFGARAYVFGDAVNEDFEYVDLCYDCARSFLNLLFCYKKGECISVGNHPDCEEISNG